MRILVRFARRIQMVPRWIAACITIAGLAAGAAALSGAQTDKNDKSPTYTVIGADGRHTFASRTVGTTDMVSLDQLASLFNFTVADDRLAGGLTVTVQGQRISLPANQPVASAAGRVVTLGGPTTRTNGVWTVAVDFLSKALGPAMGTRITVRRPSHVVVVGNLRVPQVAVRAEPQGSNGRLVIDMSPVTTARISRDGSKLLVQFEADELDDSPVSGGLPSLIGGTHTDHATLIFDLKPAVTGVKNSREGDRLVIDLLTTETTSNQPARVSGTPQMLPLDVSTPGLKTIVIDPGHGGDETGARGSGGALEKDIALQASKRLKAALESRGFRVLLTRDGDETVSIDKRTSLANNNKADVLISLHANVSLSPLTRGTQVLALSLDDYRRSTRGLNAGTRVPVVGGGSRFIETVPWDLAQIPYAEKSAALAEIVTRHLTDSRVSLFTRAQDTAPLALLVGANMPALLIEMGFLSNADDERALTSGELTGPIIDAIAAALFEVRGGIPSGPGGSAR